MLTVRTSETWRDTTATVATTDVTGEIPSETIAEPPFRTKRFRRMSMGAPHERCSHHAHNPAPAPARRGVRR